MTPEEIEQQAKTYAENIWPYIECENKHVEGEANHGIRMSREDAFTDFKAGAEAANREMKEKIEGLILKWEKMRKYSLGESKLSGGNFGNDIEETKAELLEWCIDDLKALLP